MHVLCVSATSLAHALVGTRVLHRAVSRHAARRLVPIPRHAEAHQLLGRGRLARVGSVGVGDAPPELLAYVMRAPKVVQCTRSMGEHTGCEHNPTQWKAATHS